VSKLIAILIVFALPGCVITQVGTNKNNIKTLKEHVDKHFVVDHGKPSTDPLKENESSGGFLGILKTIFSLGGNIPGEIGVISTVLGGLIVAKSVEEE